jgi:hypothetical protein
MLLRLYIFFKEKSASHSRGRIKAVKESPNYTACWDDVPIV